MGTQTLEQTKLERKNPDMFKVLLHNDDKNSMDHVVESIMQIFNFDMQKSVAIMLEAHRKGLALVTVTHLERAELYVQQLASLSLIGTIEKA